MNPSLRQQAGGEAVYQQDQLEVVTNITEDTYKPIVTWDIHQVRMSSPSERPFLDATASLEVAQFCHEIYSNFPIVTTF